MLNVSMMPQLTGSTRPALCSASPAQIDNAAGKAVFAYNATEDASVDVKLCTVEGLQQNTALVVVQGEEIYA